MFNRLDLFKSGRLEVGLERRAVRTGQRERCHASNATKIDSARGPMSLTPRSVFNYVGQAMHEDVLPRLDDPFGALLEGMRVLIVDDEMDGTDPLTLLLERRGARAVSVSSARKGYALIQTWLPDILVSDIAMPDEDGYSFISRIRLLPRERGGQIPAIALTGYARSEDAHRAIDAGFQMHVPKPVKPARLIGALAALALTPPEIA